MLRRSSRPAEAGKPPEHRTQRPGPLWDASDAQLTRAPHRSTGKPGPVFRTMLQVDLQDLRPSTRARRLPNV
jgi:hypothetical protein